MSNEEVACGVAIAVHCFDCCQNVLRKIKISSKKVMEELINQRKYSQMIQEYKKIANIIPDFSSFVYAF